eukprot:gene12384-3042_t
MGLKRKRKIGMLGDADIDISKEDRGLQIYWHNKYKGTTISLEAHAGEDTAKNIIGASNSHSLNTDELCFQSYDLAASMSGRCSSAQQKLHERLHKVVSYTSCQAHRSSYRAKTPVPSSRWGKGKEGKRERGKEGKRERGKEGKKERGKEGKRERGKEGKRERGKEGKRERGKEGKKGKGKEGKRERGKEGKRKGGKEGKREKGKDAKEGKMQKTRKISEASLIAHTM